MSVVEIKSSQKVPTQAFQPIHELRVHDDVRDAAVQFASGRGASYLLQEFTGPIGRADFVLAFPNPSRLLARREAVLQPLRVMTEARLVAALSGRYARTVDEAAETAGMTAASVRSTARRLATSGHVSVAQDGRLRRHPAVEAVVATAAYEAKVREWQSGLRQARHYALWNRWSTVVLETARNPQELLTQARRHGVGVVVAGERLAAARVQKLPGYLQLMASERVLAATNMLSEC